jgi:hypothetical protein
MNLFYLSLTLESKCIISAAVRREIELETDRITGKTKAISNMPIHLSVYSPNGKSLSLFLVLKFHIRIGSYLCRMVTMWHRDWMIHWLWAYGRATEHSNWLQAPTYLQFLPELDFFLGYM